MVLLTNSVQSSQEINQIYVFGDSLSDIGNVYRVSQRAYPPNPPYYQGRYSNGRVWVEYLAARLQLNSSQSNNFAFGGAQTGKVSNNGIPGLLSQVESFITNQKKLNLNGLYVIWAGANDYIYGAADSTTPLNNLSQAIDSLSNAGAKRILIANLPDLGNLPATSPTTNSPLLNNLTKEHNIGLSTSLNSLNKILADDSQIIMLDINTLYRDAITHPEKYGFKNVTSACIQNRTDCDNPDQFLFWDGIHPTTATHRIIGEEAFKLLKTKVASKIP